MTIWFATGNTHKKSELAAILKDYTIKIPLDEEIDFDPEESADTFLDNALIKARELYRLVKEPVIADDSGLCIDALGGRPGVRSARYGAFSGDLNYDPSQTGGGGSTGGKLDRDGKKMNDPERNALLLAELGANPRRNARFVCAMVLLLSEDRFFVAQETLEGELVRKEQGSGGFGYDPILYIPSLGRTVAELSNEEKSRVSHRGKAGRHIAGILKELHP
jgi:XTP/dITP diphosphohydrolase